MPRKHSLLSRSEIGAKRKTERQNTEGGNKTKGQNRTRQDLWHFLRVATHMSNSSDVAGFLTSAPSDIEISQDGFQTGLRSYADFGHSVLHR